MHAIEKILAKKAGKASVHAGEIVNETTGAKAKAEPMNDYMMGILQNCGIKPMIRKMQEEKNKQRMCQTVF